MTRHIKETLFLRHNFTHTERLAMGDELASVYNRLEQIEAEENVVKAQFKERKATVEQSIGQLSRNLANAFEMRNIECNLEYDNPNPFEVSYFRVDTGELVKTRALSESERQQELPLASDITAEQSQENAQAFFGTDAEGNPIEKAETPQPGDVVAADGPPEPPAKKVKEVDPNSPEAIAKAKKSLQLM